jgi:hypothetical protein
MRAIDEEFKYLLSPAVLITLVTYPYALRFSDTSV